MRDSNYPGLKEYYTRYCTLLRKVIRRAKVKYYEGMIMNASNRSKEAWKIIKRENGRESMKKPSYSV